MRFAAAAFVFLALTAAAFADDPLGRKPGYTARELSPFPNAQSITKRIWLPGLDDGYVPQGVTFQAGALFISSYRSTDPKRDRGSCRVFAVDPETGIVLSQLDLPPQCGHAGGIARGPGGNIVVADSRHIFEIEVSRRERGKLLRVVRAAALTGKLKGSFAAGEAEGLWLGAYERSGEPKFYLIPWTKLRQSKLSEVDASEAVPLPLLAQGAAFDGKGDLWITRSGSRFGELMKLDRKTGAVLVRHAMPIGIEDISFEPGGALWSLSEAGSQRWNAWSAFYPLAFGIDVDRLKCNCAPVQRTPRRRSGRPVASIDESRLDFVRSATKARHFHAHSDLTYVRHLIRGHVRERRCADSEMHVVTDAEAEGRSHPVCTTRPDIHEYRPKQLPECPADPLRLSITNVASWRDMRTRQSQHHFVRCQRSAVRKFSLEHFES